MEITEETENQWVERRKRSVPCHLYDEELNLQNPFILRSLRFLMQIHFPFQDYLRLDAVFTPGTVTPRMFGATTILWLQKMRGRWPYIRGAPSATTEVSWLQTRSHPISRRAKKRCHRPSAGWKRGRTTGNLAQYGCFRAKIDEIPGLFRPRLPGQERDALATFQMETQGDFARECPSGPWQDRLGLALKTDIRPLNLVLV
jgi:hypothetical protein